MKMHNSITTDRVIDAASRCMFGTENIGFCVSCGEQDDYCEPDVEDGKCEACGEYKVYGAEQLILHMA